MPLVTLLPYLPPSCFLIRRDAVLQGYEWKEMVRDQTAVIRHQAAMLARSRFDMLSGDLNDNTFA